MRRRSVLAASVIGALLMAVRVAVRVLSGIGVGPLDWVGQEGEKWSLGTAHSGQINQWEEVLVAGVTVGGRVRRFGVEGRLVIVASGRRAGVVLILILASWTKASSALKPCMRTLEVTMSVLHQEGGPMNVGDRIVIENLNLVYH